jgi:hypothetical protein
MLALECDNERSVPFVTHQLSVFRCCFDVVGNLVAISLNIARHICLTNRYHIGIVQRLVRLMPIWLSNLDDLHEQWEQPRPTIQESKYRNTEVSVRIFRNILSQIRRTQKRTITLAAR